jgi:hypothetical protein
MIYSFGRTDEATGDDMLMVSIITLCATKAIDRLPGNLAALHDCIADLPPTKQLQEMNLTDNPGPPLRSATCPDSRLYGHVCCSGPLLSELAIIPS